MMSALRSAAAEQDARLLDAEVADGLLVVKVESRAPLDESRFRARACWQYHVDAVLTPLTGESGTDPAPPTRRVLRQFVDMRLAHGRHS